MQYTEIRHIHGDLDTVEDLIPIITTLENRGKEYTIELHITSWGGALSTALRLVDAIQLSEATVIAVIHTAASAATLVAFACDEVRISPYATVMFHNFSVVQQGQAKKLRDKAQFDERHFSLLCNTFYKGVLTPTQIEDIQEDNDIWLVGKEVSTQMSKLGWLPVLARDDYDEW